jgi:hypothetical protein
MSQLWRRNDVEHSQSLRLYRTLARVLVQLEETGYTQNEERQVTVRVHDHLPARDSDKPTAQG